MAEAPKNKKNYGHFYLRRICSASSSNLRSNKEKDKVEKVTGNTLASCENCKKNGSPNLWANAIKVDSGRRFSDSNLKTFSKSPSIDCNEKLKSQEVCYELKKDRVQKPNKVCAWPRCTTYHPCRGSDPGALLDNEYLLSRKLSNAKNQTARQRVSKEDNKSKQKESNIKAERPSSLIKKPVGRDGDFAHVVPPPPAPIPFTFAHHDDSLLYATDYRLQYTYTKLQSMQKSVKARQAQSRAKIVAMDSRTIGQYMKSKVSKQVTCSISRQNSIVDASNKLKSPETEYVGQSRLRRSISNVSTEKKVFDIPCVQLKLGKVNKSGPDSPEYDYHQPLQLKEQNKSNDVSAKTTARTSHSLQYLFGSQSPGFIMNKMKNVSDSCSTWPQNSPSRKSENNHRNVIAAKQQRSFKIHSVPETRTVSLPSSPKKIDSLKSKRTLTPPTRRRKFI